MNWRHVCLMAASLALSLVTIVSAKSQDIGPWRPRLVICDPGGCREPPDPYWEGPWRVQRPCREWRHCYWRQKWW